ncbi:MAG: V-type ATPase 116kDa subunit family protein [Candidatus Micrarchaeaceae archaeon]
MGILYPEKMAKLRVICIEKYAKKVIDSLYEEGVVDLRKSKEELEEYLAKEEQSFIVESLLKVEGAISIIGIERENSNEIGIEKIKNEMEKMSRIIDKVFELEERKKSLKSELSLINEARRISEAFIGLDIDFSKLESRYVEYRCNVVKKNKIEKILKMANPVKYYIGNYGEKSLILLSVWNKGDEGKEIGGEEIDLRNRYLSSTPSACVKECNEREKQIKEEIEGIEREINGFKKYAKQLNLLRSSLIAEKEKADALSMLKKTKKTILLEGWVPEEHCDKLEKLLNQLCEGKIVVEVLKDEELAPTYIKSSRILRPFEYLLHFYSTPRSDEINPLLAFFISFIIFYGMMVSDVVYGLISFVLALFISKKTNPDGLMHNAAKVWEYSAISAIVFGIASNEYLGFSLGQPFSSFKIFDWIKNTTLIAGISVLFGIVQVCIGLAFGFVNKYKHGEKKLAFGRLFGILSILFGSVSISSLFFSMLPSSYALPFGVAAAISLALCGVLSGIEASELTNLITHPLSYARLMGFGLGSIIIASLIDQAFMPKPGEGILVIVAFSVIFIVLQFLNLLLSIFEGIIQGARLNFVEFFSKFYMGNGIKYRPFGRTKVG